MIRPGVSTIIQGQVARVSGFIPSFSEFKVGATAPPHHVQLSLLDKLSEQIGHLVFAQIPQFGNLSMGRLLSKACLSADTLWCIMEPDQRVTDRSAKPWEGYEFKKKG